MDLEEVLQEYNCSAEYNRSAGKSDEELARFTIDPELSVAETQVRLLNGVDLQRSVAVRNVAPLFNDFTPNERTLIVNAIENAIRQSSDQSFHLEAAECCEKLLRICEDRLIEKFQAITYFGVDTNFGACWGPTLSTLVDRFPPNSQKQYLPDFLRRCSLTCPISGRIAVAQSLGALMSKASLDSERQELLNLAQNLCQDISMGVRQATADQIPAIAAVIPRALVPEFVLELQHLVFEEEEQDVQKSALYAVPQFTRICCDQGATDDIIPLIQEILSMSDSILTNRESLQLAIAEILAPLSELMNIYRSELGHLATACTDCFCTLGQIEANNIEMANIAAELISAAGPLLKLHRLKKPNEVQGQQRTTSPLAQTIQNLLTHNTVRVRTFAAKHFRIVSKALDDSVAQQIYISLWKSVEECDLELIESLLCEAEKIKISRSSQTTSSQSLSPSTSTAGPLLSTQSDTIDVTDEPFNLCAASASQLSNIFAQKIESLSASISWRMTESFLKAAIILKLPFNPLMPVTKKLVKESSYKPIRFCCAQILTIQMKDTSVSEHREILKCLFDLSGSLNYRERSLFLSLVPLLVDIYSKKFIKCNFYDRVLSLAEDKVPNVRIIACRTLPRIKPLLTLPYDRGKLSALEQTVRNIISMEADRDVRKAMEESICELDRTAVRTQRVSSIVDEVDRAKEDHEKQYAEVEKKEKSKSLKPGKSLRRTPSNTTNSSNISR